MKRPQVWLFVLSYVAFGFDGLAIMGLGNEVTQAEQGVRDSHAIIEQLQGIESTAQSSGSKVFRYINTGNIEALKAYYQTETKTQALVTVLASSLVNEHKQDASLAGLQETLRQRMDWNHELISAYQQKGVDQALQLQRTMRGSELSDKMRARVRDLKAAETAVLKDRTQKYDMYKSLLFGAVGLLSIIGFVALWKAMQLTMLSMRLEAQQVMTNERLDALNQQLNTQVFELLRAQEETNKALRVRSEFLAKVSHELRTPLASVIGCTELALETSLSPEQRQLTDTARSSAEMLLRLVNDILDFEKLDVQQFRLRSVAFDLRSAIQSACDPIIPKMKKKGIEFELRIADDLPGTVFTDPLRLQQVLINLIDNAVKFTNVGKITVKVAVDSKSVASTMIRFTVTDTGIGITPANLEKIFDPFMQVGDAAARSQSGAGLGLSICRSLVQMMNGKIDVTSQSGQGTEFIFTVECKPDPNATAVPQAAPATPTLSANGTILVVDDNESIRALTQAQLQRLGCQVELATNSEEAIEATSKKRYALILMDVQMNGVDGVTTAEQIRTIETSLCRDVPIIAFTAYAMQGDKENLLASGMSGYIAKPATLTSLRELLEEWFTKEPATSVNEPTSVAAN